MAGSMILRMVFSTADRIDTRIFEVRSATPNLARKVGTLIGGADVVVPYNDPIWRMRLRVGPLTAAEGQMVRSAVGGRVAVLIEDTMGYTRPHAELWIGAQIEAEVLNVRQMRVGRDITRGDRYDMTLQFAQSAVG